MSDWQLIKTAPRNGKTILVAGGVDYGGEDAPEGWKDFVRAPCRARWVKGEWVTGFFDCYEGLTSYENPTHWMLLPEPPNE